MKRLIISKTAALVLWMAFSNTNAAAQQLFDSLLNVAATKYPQEKIHVHYDKTYYNPGETIWFKAYITEKGNASAISKTLYAELIDEKGNILQRKITPVFQSGAASYFDLDTVYRPKVFVRAYTSWMMNFDTSLYYLKPITLINPKQDAAVKSQPLYSLTLFPEGGDIIQNINCRVAFKANDQEGIPVNVSGTVVDSKNKVLSAFTSVHDGMGMFAYTPVFDEQYKVLWKGPDGVQRQVLLPVAKREGVAFRVVQGGGKVSYTINRPDSANDLFKQFTVFAQINQQTVYGAMIKLHQKAQVTAVIETDSLPDGIMVLTLFNGNDIPVAERLVFINNNNYYFNTDLHTSEKNLTPHGRTVLQLDVGENLLSNLSIAVTDAGLEAASKTKETIYSELLLTADLKGYVYNPAYYFSSDADSVKQYLDLVLMTNGWRRYKWEEMLAGKWPQISHQPDNYISIQGGIYGLSKTQLKDKSITAIFRTGKSGGSIFNIPVEADGKFSLKGMYFFDTAKIYYQINNDKDKRLTSFASFSFTNGFEKSPSPAYKLMEAQYFNLHPDLATLIKSAKQNALFLSAAAMDKAKTLQAVVVTGKQKSLKEKLDEQYATGLFSGGFARVFTTEDDPFAQSAMSILDYLQGKVPGLQITTAGTPSITRRGSSTSVFLNEMQTDLDVLQSTPMTDVAMIKVFDPPFMGAAGGGAGGAVAVYTKKGGNTSNIKGLNESTVYGYSAWKEFYMPDYSKIAATGGDYRSTLYWNPFVLMDAKTRRVSIPVFNSSNCKKMKVVIEGINELGQLTREEKVFE
ncbi:MAG: hypothetical protein U0V75_03165 [Ferruginibacter sp.]